MARTRHARAPRATVATVKRCGKKHARRWRKRIMRRSTRPSVAPPLNFRPLWRRSMLPTVRPFAPQTLGRPPRIADSAICRGQPVIKKDRSQHHHRGDDHGERDDVEEHAVTHHLPIGTWPEL